MFSWNGYLHCKISYRFSRPQSGCHKPNSPCRPGIIKFTRPGRVWYCKWHPPSGHGKTANLFLQCSSFTWNSSSFSASLLSMCCLSWVSSSWTLSTLFSSCSSAPSASDRADSSSSFSASSRFLIRSVRAREIWNIPQGKDDISSDQLVRHLK